MNEEWYNDRIRTGRDDNWVTCYRSFSVPQLTSFQRPNYDTWLNQIVVSYQTLLDGKDRTFSRFLLDLPSVPRDVLALLRDLCVDADRYDIAFSLQKWIFSCETTLIECKLALQPYANSLYKDHLYELSH